ncbi:hypothetical protein Tco_0496082 [Tanacetum coccineum]
MVGYFPLAWLACEDLKNLASDSAFSPKLNSLADDWLLLLSSSKIAYSDRELFPCAFHHFFLMEMELIALGMERHRCSFVLSSDSVRIVNAVLVILIDDVYHGRCVLEDDGVCVVRWIKSCLILPISYEEIETGVIFRHCVERYAWFHSCDMRVDIVGHPDSLQ